MEESKVSPKGQIVIPKRLRDKLGIKKGEKVTIEEADEVLLVMKQVKRPVQAMRGLFKGKTKKPSVELVREIRDEWEKDLENELA